MKKYGVFFEEKCNGNWTEDYFTMNGEGFDYDDAVYIANDLKSHGADGIPVRNVTIKELTQAETV